ncbi:hypothetical protein PPYR_15476 [Photinus pyralis]|uniref:Tc1-like transposase DDE domain-containing protein n=1 Tax=Photinus pyralis TaxID=7054 RepID=A0A5N3ZYQ9_PHOPY|nr:hypothetical protein PPYR_15476 [Photinus pyralis]
MNVYDYFVKEKNHGGVLTSVMAVQQRTADAVQVSKQTVVRTCAMREIGSDLKRNPYRRSKPRRTDLLENKKIRYLIYDMYANKEHVTLDTLLAVIKLKDLCDLGRTSLFYALKEMGFKFKMTNSRRGSCEQSHVVSMRNVFLRKYIRNLESEVPHDFVFLEETWVFSRGATKRTWQDDRAKNGKRYIIIHAGGRNGFIEGSSLIFSSTNKSFDYHDNMNAELFEKWFEESFLKKLAQPSIIVLDNASYHTRKSEKIPRASSTKEEISNWLKMKNRPFAKVTPDVWNRCVTHTEEIIKDTFNREKIIDDVRALVFTVNTGSDEESDYLSESDNDNDA